MNTDEIDWDQYYETVKNRPPRDTLLKALSLFDSDDENFPKIGVDLGAGVGNDTRELLFRGWKVFAYDKQESAFPFIRRGLSNQHLSQLITEAIPFESLVIPINVSLVNASYSIPFCATATFYELWGKIKSNLSVGGRFCGQIFGNEDEWAGSENMSFFTKEEMLKLFDSFEIEDLIEINEDSTVASGEPKHWHVFHIVARKL